MQQSQPLSDNPALNAVTALTYDTNKAQVLTVTDPNGLVTSATYDDFGRILSVRRPGDESGTATQTYAYTNATLTTPFYTTATQNIDDTLVYTIRKYYDGLGRLLQTQVVNAKVGTADRDILVDTYYDSTGQLWKQSAPYDVATGGAWHTRDTGKAKTETLYDALGRVKTSKATDGSTQASYTYSDLYDTASAAYFRVSCVTDALGRQTCTRSDEWGRTAEVHPPLDPWTRYTYTSTIMLTA